MIPQHISPAQKSTTPHLPLYSTRRTTVAWLLASSARNLCREDDSYDIFSTSGSVCRRPGGIMRNLAVFICCWRRDGRPPQKRSSCLVLWCSAQPSCAPWSARCRGLPGRKCTRYTDVALTVLCSVIVSHYCVGLEILWPNLRPSGKANIDLALNYLNVVLAWLSALYQTALNGNIHCIFYIWLHHEAKWYAGRKSPFRKLSEVTPGAVFLLKMLMHHLHRKSSPQFSKATEVRSKSYVSIFELMTTLQATRPLQTVSFGQFRTTSISLLNLC